jgi:hypothetical protein
VKLLHLILEVDHYHRLIPCALLHLEGPVLHVLLHGAVTKLPTNESLRVKDRVSWISGYLVLGRVTYKSLVLSECYVGGRRIVALVVRDNLYFVVQPDTYTGVGGAEVYTDGWATLSLSCC